MPKATETKSKATVVRDPEVAALDRIDRLLRSLPRAAVDRVLKFLVDRWATGDVEPERWSVTESSP